MPSVIMAKAVARCFVAMMPNSMASPMPHSPASRGISSIGTGRSPAPAASRKWIVAYPPMPKNVAWHSENSPACPSSMLYDSARITIMPDWLSMEIRNPACR